MIEEQATRVALAAAQNAYAATFLSGYRDDMEPGESDTERRAWRNLLAIVLQRQPTEVELNEVMRTHTGE